MSSQVRRFWAYLGRNETAKGLFLVGVVLLGAIGIWAGIRVALNTEFPVLVVSSGSMCQYTESSFNECTLPVGSLIVIRGQDPSSIVVGPYNLPAGAVPNGSIIVFRPGFPYNSDPNYLVVHRVVGKAGGNFITRGDANGGACNCRYADDEWDPSNGGPGIPPGNIVGVYQYTIPIPYLGNAILGIRNFMYDDTTGQPKPEGLAVIVLLIVALFAFEIIEPSNKKKPAKPTPAAEPSSSAQPEEPSEGEPSLK